MLRLLTPVFLLVILLSMDIYAQNPLYFTQHRPSGLNWQELNSPHFRIIFAEGDDAIARRAARILESQYATTYELTGGKLRRFPVVLSPYNDVTNGFVSSVNFRSEVDISPFKGKALNPQSGSWLETVLPHELLHANHANVTNPFSLASVFGLLGPDYRRSFNLFPPLGVHEGLAVYHESENGIRENSGRSNYTYFQNQFNANLAGPNTWNMGQTLITSDYTIPADRHYVAGSTFTKWLHQEYGDDISKRAIRVHQNLFFLGYGYALKHVTGKWPGQLYNEYKGSQYFNEESRLSSLNESTDDYQLSIDSPFKGVRQQRPIWISESEILYYSRQYNAPGAFYIYNVNSKSTNKVSEHFLVGDYYMNYEYETNQLFIAESFSINRIFSNYQPDIVRLNVRTGSEFRISKGERLYAPDKKGSNLYALQPSGDVSNIVKFESNSVIPLTDFKDKSAVAVKASPHNEGELAVIINQRGVQALWLVNEESIQSDLSKAPTLAFKNGSIHDPVWHPTENKLIFTMDAYPAMNIYEFDVDTEEVLQLTNSRYNAMEASYHPDNGSIVYVSQNDNERNISILEEERFINRIVDDSELLQGIELNDAINAPFLGDDLIVESESWEISGYGKDYRWLKPRAILPVIQEVSGSSEYGATILSTDVLQSQLYSIQLTTLEEQLWYNINYTNKTFYPGFSISVYKEPTIDVLRFSDGTPEGTFLINSLIEENGMNLSFPFEYYFNDVDRFSSFFIRPGLSYNQLQYNTLQSDPISNTTNEWNGRLFTQLNIRLLQKPRDIQPSSGFQLFLQMDRILNDTELQFSTENFETRLQVLEKRRANFLGANWYYAPFPKTNQSLRLTAQFLRQSDRRLYSNSSIIPFGYGTNPFSDSSSLGRFSSRYTIPVAYPDNGGLLVPFYMSNIFVSLFSHSLVNYDTTSQFDGAQTVIGAGVHFRFKLSNLAFDLGLGVTYNMNSNSTDFIMGSF